MFRNIEIYPEIVLYHKTNCENPKNFIFNFEDTPFKVENKKGGLYFLGLFPIFDLTYFRI